MGRLAALLVGAIAMYFVDPERGRARRAYTRDRLMRSARSTGDRAARAARRARAEVVGTSRRVTSDLRPDEPPPNDATLVHKIQSELGRDDIFASGRVSIDATDGVVYLRGQLDRPDEIRRAADLVRRVDGVVAVENLLHLPGAPAR